MALRGLDWNLVRAHYDRRVTVHQALVDRLDHREEPDGLCALLLGISDPAGNYSAAERGLGPTVLASNGPAAAAAVAALAAQLRAVTKASEVPRLIRAARLRHLTIEVGSEASCLLNPTVCWVANARTIWAHLLISHGDDVERAHQELAPYVATEPSETEVARWFEIHRLLEASLTRIA